jgi:hypothetical protein
MSNRRGSYPHPVLDATDDVDSNFVVDRVSYLSGALFLTLDLDVSLDDKEMAALLRDRKAHLILRWRCGQTMKLGHIALEHTVNRGVSKSYAVTLSQDEVAGKVEFDVQIVAAVAISGYHLTKQSADYGSHDFDVREGDLLGIAGSFSVYADKMYDPAQPPLEACFRFERDTSVKLGIELDYEGQDAVVVRIAPKTYERFVTQQTRPEFQVATVLVPAMIATLAHLQDDLRDGGLAAESNWGQSLGALVERYGVGGKSVIEQAQTILQDPIGRAIEAEYEIEEES